MAKVTNYAVQKNKGSPDKILVEVTGVEVSYLCRATNRFIYIIPRCAVEVFITEKAVLNLIGKPVAGDFERVLVKPYQVIHWPSKTVYEIIYHFGFRYRKTNEVLGIKAVESYDIKTSLQ
ncbi:hypothetical protein PDL71_01950 [Lacibacter sp. MH-610]|uniref:hypothetical protein n=1 Tax=Lacibacter sp. MH-610 TaxID=3020883 RepID=UPI0038922B06